MALTEAEKQKIREEEKYRQAVDKSISEKRTKSQKYGVPLLLSIFVPGLGQIVKGQARKGFIIFFAPIIVFSIFFISSFINNNPNVVAELSKIWLASIVLYIWQLVDAYNN